MEIWWQSAWGDVVKWKIYGIVKMGDMMVTKCGDVVAKEGRCGD